MWKHKIAQIDIRKLNWANKSFSFKQYLSFIALRNIKYNLINIRKKCNAFLSHRRKNVACIHFNSFINNIDLVYSLNNSNYSAK